MPLLEGGEGLRLKLASAEDAAVDQRKSTKLLVVDDSSLDSEFNEASDNLNTLIGQLLQLKSFKQWSKIAVEVSNRKTCKDVKQQML